MLCAKPYGVHPCGRCEPCLINRRRTWAARIVLEAMCHEESAFATLTYKPEKLPVELKPRHMQLFLKRLRRRLPPKSLRYYGAGEYGDKTGRPHYHLALFGIGRRHAELVAQAWAVGFVSVGDLTIQSAQYVAKYVVKGLFRDDSPELLGRHPEFARMSLRPGIGAEAMRRLGLTLEGRGESESLARRGDVPGDVRISGGRYPLGRYLRARLREEVGWGERTPVEIVRALAFQKALQSDDEVRKEEGKRAVSARNAHARLSIEASKRRSI